MSTEIEALRSALANLLKYFGGPQGVSMAELGRDAYVSLEMKVRIGDLIDAHAALSGSPAPSPDIEELIIAAYVRGAKWADENMRFVGAGDYLNKAARDYADYTMNSRSISASSAPSTEGLREWQPIETAPLKEAVLIAGGRYFSDQGWETPPGDQYTGITIASRYSSTDEYWRGDQLAHDEYFWHQPTHWMPLPPAPDAARTALAAQEVE